MRVQAEAGTLAGLAELAREADQFKRGCVRDTHCSIRAQNALVLADARLGAREGAGGSEWFALVGAGDGDAIKLQWDQAEPWAALSAVVAASHSARPPESNQGGAPRAVLLASAEEDRRAYRMRCWPRQVSSFTISKQMLSTTRPFSLTGA